jgi:hypothetical protein
MIIVTKDTILYPTRHMATSQSAMCHNFVKNQYIYILSNQILPHASLLT